MSDVEGLAALEAWIGGLIQSLEGPARLRLLRQIGRDLQAAQRRRIRANLDPDGEPFAPRRPRTIRADARKRRGAARTGPMFQRAGDRLGRTVSDDMIDIGFDARASGILRIHHEGQTAALAPFDTAPRVQFARRRLLGLSDQDRDRILTTITRTLERAAGG